jgi:neutral ceramidase
MAAQTGTYLNPITNRVENYRGCLPAMGMSFGAGTTDGPGGFNFSQGSTSGNPFWDSVRDFIAEPTEDDIRCHDPKPILLNTGRTSRPYQWQPAVVPTQMFRIGDLVILGLPGEFTTMAGRRLRTEIQNRFGQNLQIILSGITNTYSSYIVTPEEYQVQRYEGASTIYGPHTLTIYISQFTRLFTALNSNQVLPPGPNIPDERSSQMTFLTPVINDSADGSSFGAVLAEPRKNYRRGETVFASFISGNPRNNLMTQSSFFSVEQLQGSGAWRVIATDANWETRFVWRRTSSLLGRSEIDFIWEIPANVANGEYRVRHNGSARGPVTGIRAYVGITHQFTIA